MSIRYLKNQGGFTLVELMVSLAVFSIVMTVSVGTLLVLVDMNAKAQALYSASTNLSFALDSLAREVRTGYHYYCSSTYSETSNFPDIADKNRDCLTGDFISFMREENGAQMAYWLDGGVIKQRIRDVDGTPDTGWMPITADDVVVESFEIVVENSDTLNGGSDSNQPTINLKVRGYVENGLDTNTDFFIQTRIVQRRIDIL